MAKLTHTRAWGSPFIFVIIILASLGFGQPAQLKLTVKTDKESYTYRQIVEIEGYSTLNDLPANGLIGIQVNTPNNKRLITRTATIQPTLDTKIEILNATPCDVLGTPKTTFAKNEYANINVTIKNNDLNAHRILITVCTYDSDYTPILPDVSFLQMTIQPQTTIQYIPTIFIESWVSTGQGTFHVNVFSDWLEKGGYPYCPEKTATFIIETQDEHQENYEYAANGYRLEFRLPPDAPAGAYMINASACSQGEITYATTSFIKAFQTPADINFDNVVNILDLVMIATSYGARCGSPQWKPQLDINPDGIINIQDIIAASLKYCTAYAPDTIGTKQEIIYASELSYMEAKEKTTYKNREVSGIGTGVDSYTCYSDLFNGKGLNEPSDMFGPMETVKIYAHAVYNNWPEQGKNIIFQIIDPYGNTIGILQNRTDENGLTFISFKLPWLCEDPEYYFGTWTVKSTVDIAGIVYYDTLTFTYDYRVRIWHEKTTTDKALYRVQETATLTVNYGTCAQQIFSTTFRIDAYDDVNAPFAYVLVQTTVGGAQYKEYTNDTMILNIYIPKKVRTDEATFHIRALKDFNFEALSPKCLITTQIECN